MSRIVGRKIRWASEATQGSQDKLRHQGTMLANQHSWADNLALLEDWRQAFVWVLASPYFVPTAFKWIALYLNEWYFNNLNTLTGPFISLPLLFLVNRVAEIAAQILMSKETDCYATAQCI